MMTRSKKKKKLKDDGTKGPKISLKEDPQKISYVQQETMYMTNGDDEDSSEFDEMDVEGDEGSRLRRSKRLQTKKPSNGNNSKKRKSTNNMEDGENNTKKRKKNNKKENFNLTDSEELAATVLANLSTVLDKELKINNNMETDTKFSQESTNKSWKYIINLLNQEPQISETIKQEKINEEPFLLQPPKFPGLSSKWVDTVIDPFLLFNNTQLVFKRCETHRAITYYIHYYQKYNLAKEMHQKGQKFELNETTMDPTMLARRLKDKSPKSNFSQRDTSYSSMPTQYSLQYQNQQINNLQSNRYQLLKEQIVKEEQNNSQLSLQMNTKSLSTLPTINSLPSPSFPINRNRIDTILTQNSMDTIQSHYSFL